MPPTTAPGPRVIDQAQSTRALAQVIVEENKQCFTHAYISNMAKVEEVLKKKCGSDPFRIQYNLGNLTIWARQKISREDLYDCFEQEEKEG